MKNIENAESQIQKMINLLGQKKELLNELLDLYQYHEKFCRDEKLDKLNRLIKSQSLKVDKLKKIDEKMEKIIGNIKEDCNLSGLKELEEINTVKEEINNLLIKIYGIDQKNRNIAMAKYEELRKKVININQARKVRNKYIRRPVSIGGVFVDRREKTGK